jgi:nitroimidazol reductase NimA-like FMN-containing flavoprotein (pyridoxamine 5'-phosphate oxidase superfamily)
MFTVIPRGVNNGEVCNMLGELDGLQIEDLLMSLPVGRIGCHADGVTYIIPINYVYENDTIYAHSKKGMKIDMMRKNPNVCFQVDAIDDLLNWESVIAWGRFEEIFDMHEKTFIMQKIINRVMPLLEGNTAHPSHGFTANAFDVGEGVELILYKIHLDKKTGRFEKK